MINLQPFKKAILRLDIWLSLATARALIAFVPFKWWRASLGEIKQSIDVRASHALASAKQKQAGDIGRLIKRIAARQWFRAVCLPQAMAGRWVMARRNIPSHIVLGSRREDEGGQIGLHAWLVVGDDVVTGDTELETYRAFDRSLANGSPSGRETS